MLEGAYLVNLPGRLRSRIDALLQDSGVVALDLEGALCT